MINPLSFATLYNSSNNLSSITRRKILRYGALSLGATALPSLSKTYDNSDLQKKLSWLIKNRRKKGKISRYERTSWSVYDFHNRKKLVSINENYPMQAASMIKVFVALAYFYLNSKSPRKYPYKNKHRRLMEKMLVKSDNKATNTIMRLCHGPNNIRRLCHLATTNNRFHQLRIVEYIPASGRTYRNQASAHDYSRFLYDLWHDRFPYAKELKRIMSIKNKDRITSNFMASNTTVFDKTGSTGMLCGDMGIVSLGKKNLAYTFIGIIERSKKTQNYRFWINNRANLMREASGLVYLFMVKRYHLLKSIG